VDLDSATQRRKSEKRISAAGAIAPPSSFRRKSGGSSQFQGKHTSGINRASKHIIGYGGSLVLVFLKANKY